MSSATEEEEAATTFRRYLASTSTCYINNENDERNEADPELCACAAISAGDAVQIEIVQRNFEVFQERRAMAKEE